MSTETPDTAPPASLADIRRRYTEIAPPPDPADMDALDAARYHAMQAHRLNVLAHAHPDSPASQELVDHRNAELAAVHTLRTLMRVDPHLPPVRQGIADRIAREIVAARLEGDTGDWTWIHCSKLGVDPDEIRRLAEAELAADRARTDGDGTKDAGDGERTPEALRAELETLRRKVAGYENAITWNTSCLGCASDLNSAIREHERAERAEAELARLRAETDTLAAFWLVTDEDGDVILSSPCADTLGCLWSFRGDGERVTLGELMTAAKAHTGTAAGEAHATLAGFLGLNDGNLFRWSGATAPGGYVCAVPVPGNPDGICGEPVESEPCSKHRDPAWRPE